MLLPPFGFLNTSRCFVLSRCSPKTSRGLISLAGLIVFKDGRFWDNGLDLASRDLLASASGPPSSGSSGAVHHPVSVLKDKLPGSKARIPHLRQEPADPPCFSENGKSSIAAKFWSGIWAPRAVVPVEAERESFLSGYSKRVNRSLLSDPSLDDVSEAIKRSNNSSPGPDGIPFAAWRAAPDLASPLLFSVLSKICNGQPPPKGFNFGILFLIPKKPSGLVSDTRPISVTNTDNRLLASVVAHLIMPAVSELVDPSQKGFLSGKNGHEHTLKINEFFFDNITIDAKLYKSVELVFYIVIECAEAFTQKQNGISLARE